MWLPRDNIQFFKGEGKEGKTMLSISVRFVLNAAKFSILQDFNLLGYGNAQSDPL